MHALILASKSPYRANLLRRWGLEFIQAASKVDEAQFKSKFSDPHELVRELSFAKATALKTQYQSHIIIGSDQVLVSEGKIYGKAGSMPKALEQLLSLRGKKQTLITGVAVIYGTQESYHVDQTEILFRNFSEQEAKRSLELDAAWDCAGSMKIEGTATWLIEKLQTSDPSAIEGLPLIALAKILRSFGHAL